MDWDLPVEHYRQAAEHESAIVCLVLLDRKTMRFVEEMNTNCFIDPFWRLIFVRLLQDCWQPLADCVGDIEAFGARMVADRIRSPITGAPRVFAHNIHWHVAEVLRLKKQRDEFLHALDFVLENCA